MDDEHIYKNHNKTMLLYHLVFPAKYRRKVFTEEVGERLKEICMEIEKCYEIRFVEIGMEEDHVHFFSTERTEVSSNKDCNDNKKHNSKGNIYELSEDKEGNSMGRSTMDKWLLCKYSWTVCKQRNDYKIYTKSGTGKEQVQKDI